MGLKADDKMRFFELKFAELGGRKFPRANGYGPLEHMPFFNDLPEVSRTSLRAFWELTKQAPGLEIEREGRQWPHLIGNSNPPPSFFASEMLVADLVAAGIDYLRVTEMPIAIVKSKVLREITPPRYYVLEAAPGILRDWHAMGVPTDLEGNPIMKPLPKPWPPLKTVCKLSSWSGEDLFRYEGSPRTATLLCTQRVKELAEKKGWANVRFDSVEVVE
jgi:hypothetical protein